MVKLIRAKHYAIVNIDATVMAQAPRLSAHIDQMCANIAEDCNLLRDAINVKATTTEKLGFVGREEGIAAEAVCLLQRFQI